MWVILSLAMGIRAYFKLKEPVDASEIAPTAEIVPEASKAAAEEPTVTE